MFFFQAEDGIRDLTVTGVQTCALPILTPTASEMRAPCSTRASTSRPRLSWPSAWPACGAASRAPRSRSEERRVGKGVDLGGRRIIKKKKKRVETREFIYTLDYISIVHS